MRVVLSGGGTGGHVYPALSIAEECLKQEPGSEFLYIGTDSGLERGIVAKTAPSIPFEAVEIRGFRRKLSAENVKNVIRFFRGVSRSKALLRQFKPDVVVGTGGYVCGPVLYAASRLGIPTVIHEQNAIPGLTNKFLSRFVDTVGVSFKGSEKQFLRARRSVFTGNPRATTVARADAANGFRSLNLQPGDKLVTVVGGSGGAKALNEAMTELSAMIDGLAETHFLFVTGERYFEATQTVIRERTAEWPKRLQLVPYVHNMHEVLAATSLIVSRAGASFLAEITALGIPSILVPSPNVTNNHQEANARLLEQEGAAEVLLELDLSGNSLFAAVRRILDDPIRREHMALNSKQMGNTEAAALFYREMARLAKTATGL